jgi:hypothetical protein
MVNAQDAEDAEDVVDVVAVPAEAHPDEPDVAEPHLDEPYLGEPTALDALLEPEPAVDLRKQAPEAEELPAEASEEPVAPRRRRLFGRRRRKQDAAPADDFVGELAFEPVLEPGVDAEAAEAAEPETAETPEQELKALREQLRALELVVQQQSADHPTAALAKVEETVAEQSAAYLRQVSLVVSGLAAHTSEDENPRRTLARVAAAVERLGVPNSMERPILPVSHELTSRHHGDSRHPSHLLQPQELGTGADSDPTPRPVADVFAGLDAAAAAAAPAAPYAPVLPPVHEPVDEPVHEPVHPAVPQAGQPLLPTYEQPPVPPQPDATAVLPVFGQPTGNVHDLSSLAAYDGGYDGSYDGGYEPATEVGIPAFEEPAAVLPVPPPASAEPTGRRRGRKAKSGKSKSR